jgi:hypothetical protein
VTGPVARVDGWLLRPAPAERLAALRILIGGFAAVYAVVKSVDVWQVAGFDARRWAPVGPLVWLDAPPPVWAARAALLVLLATGPAFAAGWRWRVTGPVFAVLFLVMATYRNSWGHVLHTDHLLALHLLVLALAPASDVWSVDARRAHRPRAPAASGYGWAIQVISVVTVVTYVLAGVAKLRNGGTAWLSGEVLRNHVSFDNLRKALLGDIWSPIGGAMAAHPWMFTPFALLTVVVEIGAPLALLGGRLRTAWAAAAWAFHVGVVAVMAITFPYPVLGFAYLSFFRAERLVAGMVRRLRASVRSSHAHEAHLRYRSGGS